MAEIVLVGFVWEVEMGGGVLVGIVREVEMGGGVLVGVEMGGVVWEVVLVQETETVALETEMGLVLDAGTGM